MNSYIADLPSLSIEGDRLRGDCYLASMILGKVNSLKVNRHSDFGFYLIDEAGAEVLLPNAFVTDDLREGDQIDVFVYTDSEDRIVATTLKPRIRLGEFAWLKCKDVNQMGAFADWGMSKDLFIPFAEQLQRMEAGNFYPIHLLEDERTKRLIGSSRIRDFLEMEEISLEPGEKVELFFYERNEFGYAAVINEKYRGLLFQSDVHKPIRLGDKMPGYVKVVREDGKVDVVLTPPGYRQAIDTNTQVVLDALIAGKGSLALTDKSSPELIKQELGLSKKAFKRAIGSLYKEKLVKLEKTGIQLLDFSKFVTDEQE